MDGQTGDKKMKLIQKHMLNEPNTSVHIEFNTTTKRYAIIQFTVPIPHTLLTRAVTLSDAAILAKAIVGRHNAFLRKHSSCKWSFYPVILDI